MNDLLAVLRMTTIVIVAVVGLAPIFLASLIPVKIRGARAPLWVVTFLARIFNLIFNVHAQCLGKELLCRHEGIVFVNHMSYLEALALLSLRPVRFLAAVEVRERPVSGWMAEQAETVFVKREDKNSRTAARESIERMLRRSLSPPLVVFPEGRLGQGDRLLPFSYGVFEVAAENRIPYLVCALQFNQPDAAIWRGPRGERLGSAIWRLARTRGKIYVDIMPLYVAHPTPQDDPRQLARRARRAIAEKLGLLDQLPA